MAPNDSGTPPLDHEALDAQRAAWDAVAAGWRRWMGAFEAGAQVVNERLVDGARIATGQSVLDVATGVGEPARTAAARVGPSGRVVAVDLAPQMVELAAERIAEAGFDHVDFRVGDAERMTFDAPFDAAVCRWGLMLFVDPVAGARAIHRALVPGGRFSAAVWTARDHVPALALAGRVLGASLGLPAPDPDAPGPFRLAERARFEAVFERAGFTIDVVDTVDAEFSFASAEDYVRFIVDLSSATRKALDSVSEAAREQALGALADAARAEHADGGTAGAVRFTNTTWCVDAVAGPSA